MLTLKELQKERQKLKDKKERLKFWESNKKNFEKNAEQVLKELLRKINIPKKWNISLATLSFIPKKELMPYDASSFSSTELLAAAPAQGYEILLLLNKARLSFLSKTAMAPTLAHELIHVKQASEAPEQFLDSITQDDLSRELETEADIKSMKILDDQFRKQEVLELVLYCYDLGGWTSASKMSHFWHKEIPNMYGGGYLPGMTFAEYRTFQESMKLKDINLFIEYFHI